ncbi:MAG TPA: hypothetical protein VJN92_00270 [Candidatus Acidoferrum sp.]|nr:hypothetical protein [Candidatus Acidoferrum sp.]
MRAGAAAKTGLRIVAVCIAFGVCLAIGGALAGVAKTVPKEAQAPTSPGGLVVPFAVFCLCVGSVVSYLVLRSGWHGLRLAGVLFGATYGISTIATQVESLFFLSAKMPRALIRALFLQGAIAMALFAPLAVLILGEWKHVPAVMEKTEGPRHTAVAMTGRIALLVVAFVFLYLFFGYYVAWRDPVLREYYGGTDAANFYEAVKSNWEKQPLLFALQVFRALLYVACVYPLLRMLRGSRWKSILAITAFLASWTTALLLPNPLMPATVARSHLWETLGFNLTFGVLMGWLLGKRDA